MSLLFCSANSTARFSVSEIGAPEDVLVCEICGAGVWSWVKDAANLGAAVGIGDCGNSCPQIATPVNAITAVTLTAIAARRKLNVFTILNLLCLLTSTPRHQQIYISII
jgi:hypothetical protein